MTYVPPDGPRPNDLAIVGESPGAGEVAEGRGFVGPSGRVLWKREDGDLGLMGTMAGRPRETVYVSNVCKVPLPEHEWRQLRPEERSSFERELLAELDGVGCRLVLAFGTRAASILVPGFTSMTADHGKPVLGPTSKWVAMAVWHPAAYLRGNSAALGMIATDLAKVEALLLDGLVELLQPPSTEWAQDVGFLHFAGLLKTGRCLLCGSKDVAAYSGEGLKWKLCKPHAEAAALWAKTHLPALGEHRDDAIADAASSKMARAAEKAEAELRRGWAKTAESYGRE